MTVTVREDGVIELAGRCGVDDAEALQRHLLTAPESTIEWATCEQLHAAVLQVLLISKPRIQGVPSSPFLSAHVAPLVRRETR
jgi:hypothetical protein